MINIDITGNAVEVPENFILSLRVKIKEIVEKIKQIDCNNKIYLIEKNIIKNKEN